jgi:hypothetical protein
MTTTRGQTPAVTASNRGQTPAGIELARLGGSMAFRGSESSRFTRGLTPVANASKRGLTLIGAERDGA